MKIRIDKYIFVFFTLFIILFPISYLGVSLTRQKIFEYRIKNEMMYLENEISPSEIKIIEDFKNIDKDDENQLSQFGWNKSYFIRNYYFVEGEKYILNNSYNNLLLRIFDVYGKEYMLSQIGMISMVSASNSAEYFNLKNEYNYINKLNSFITIWEKEGGKKKENWWSDFERSDQYREFIREIFSDIENKQDSSLNEIYEKITSINEHSDDPLRNFVINNYLIPIHKWLAEFAYERYLNDKKNGDYIAALVDANIIYTTWGYWNGFKDARILMIISILKNMPDAKFSNIYLDIILIFILNILFSFIFLLLWIMRIERKLGINV